MRLRSGSVLLRNRMVHKRVSVHEVKEDAEDNDKFSISKKAQEFTS